MLYPPSLMESAKDLIKTLTAKKLMLGGAESCTGGLVSGLITAIPGSSACFDHATTVYSNQSKQEVLGVPEDIIKKYGAVSPECAKEMTSAVLNNQPVDLAYAVTGIAGPGGGTPEKPVGLVYIGYGLKENIHVQKFIFDGDRESIRIKSVEEVIKKLLLLLK